MELEFTDEQDELRENVCSVLDRECSSKFVREVFEGRSDAGSLMSTVGDLGWTGLTIAEDDGGLGLGFVELGIVLEELGRRVAPGSYLTTTTQFVPAVRDAGSTDQRERWLAGVLAGEVSGALVVEADTDDERGPMVLCGAEVSHFAVARSDGSMAVVPAERATVERIETSDHTRSLARVRIAGDAIDVTDVLPGASRDVLARVLEEAVCGLAIETVGTTLTIFDMTLAYAKEREQFDRPIGSFQAVKHKLADMFVAADRAQALCVFASAAIAEDDERRTLAVSMAKSAAGDAQRLITKEGLQLHGGIGYTWEHELHLFLRRAKTGDALLGTAREHRARVAELLEL